MRALPISGCFLFLLITSFFTIACAQIQHIQEVKEQQHIAANTYLLNNETNLIPLKQLDERKIASLSINFKASASFDGMLSKYAHITRFNSNTGDLDLSQLDEQLKFYNTLVISMNAEAPLSKAVMELIEYERLSKDVILHITGDIQKLTAIDTLACPLIWSSETTEDAAQFAAQIIFGGMPASGKLARNISPRYPTGSGFITQKIRLGYVSPEAVGISSKNLYKPIDRIVQEAISAKASPSAVVLVVKNGQVIFEKAYGHHTYQNARSTETDDIFDLASITKISATTLAVMRLEEEGLIDLNKTMGHYLLQAKNSNKNQTLLKDVMLHQAGFIPFIPFYRDLAPSDLRRDSSATYADKVADACYIRTGYYQEVMWPTMLQSKINPPGKYVYSDISMYVMKEVVEQQSQTPIQDYVQQQFYQPLGMYHTGFLPRLRFPKDKIVPTEDDATFRKTLLQGFVHDQGAAMASGIAGHAGNFSTANDLAIYGQLLLNEGLYGDKRYFKAETVRRYTSKQAAASRRGLGFDRWDPDTSKEYPSKLASPATYGHTGYTGTCIWIDPEQELTYIFLSNRVHPKVSNKLAELNIRSRIQDAIYTAIGKGLDE